MQGVFQLSRTVSMAEVRNISRTLQLAFPGTVSYAYRRASGPACRTEVFWDWIIDRQLAVSEGSLNLNACRIHLMFYHASVGPRGATAGTHFYTRRFSQSGGEDEFGNH